MDQTSIEVFKKHREHLLESAAGVWGLDGSPPVELDGFENHMFEVYQGNRPFILRFCHSLHRTEDQVRGEMDWLRFLVKRGLSVAAPVADQHGEYYRVMPVDDSCFIVALYQKAPGRPPQRSDFTDSFVQSWGELAGEIHRATREYEPADGVARRFHWHEDPTIELSQYRDRIDEKVLALFENTVECIKSLPVDPEGYGLIHNDLHPGNMFVDGDRLTAFDFDDCHYQYFVNDIAMALFYALPMPDKPEENGSFARNFLTQFLTGYRQAMPIKSEALGRIPALLKLREIDLYCQIILQLGTKVGGWAGAYLQGRRERIIAGVPVVDVDFTRF